MAYQPTHDWKQYLDCQCFSREHVIVLEYDEEMGLILSVQARQNLGFFRRIREAFRYVFGRPARWMRWDETLIRPEDVPKLEEWLQQAKEHGTGTMYK